MSFTEFTATAASCSPYPYQQTLAEGPNLPTLLRVPTGAGKTEAAALGWLYRRFAHPDATVRNATPRRLVYCLPMRVLVEQTVARIEKWLDSLDLASHVGLVSLMYVCQRCNNEKGNQFPGKTTPNTPGFLRVRARMNERQYIDPAEADGYVNPRDPDERAEDFFVFDEYGQIQPNDNLDDLRWAKALQTIIDFNLNPVGGIRANDLPFLRMGQFHVLSLDELPEIRRILERRLGRNALGRRYQFSSFIAWKAQHISEPSR